jgi:1-acyl-sn-glycerol-3-phosphate acyltransferase
VAEDWKFEPAHDLGLSRQEQMRSLRRETGLGFATTNLLWRIAMRSYLAVAHRLEIEGRERLPQQPPFVLVANHSSHLDAPILGSALPTRFVGRIFPIAAGDTFFEQPILATFAAACVNALPIWRKRCGSHSLEELRRRLIEGNCIYILFPEGTRTRTGEIGKFKPGLGRLICGSAVPVIPCHLDGAWAAMPPGRSIPRFGKIKLRIGSPLIFEATPNTREGWIVAAEAAENAVRLLGQREVS